ncbi:hypothetical protein ACIGBH_42115 [Streptomyces sp. NPDC085929]
MLAQAAEVVPPVRPLASGVAYEQKFDGYRVLVFTSAGPGGRVLLQTRHGALVQGAFPDLVAAAEAQLPLGVLVREYWAPKVARLRRKSGQMCRRISDRLGTEDEASAEVVSGEDVRRLPERI